MVLGISAAVKGLRNRSWPRVDAVITASTVEEEGFDPVSYRLSITYRYTVNGQSYVGHNIFDGLEANYSWKWVADMARDRYAIGLSVDAYYSPSNPASAVLKRGLSRGPFISWAIMVSVILLLAWKQYVLGIGGAS